MSRINLGAKPYSTPQPVWILAAYDENGVANAMNAAWGGISEMNEVSVGVIPFFIAIIVFELECFSFFIVC